MSTGVIFILGKGVSPILASGVKSTWPQGSSAPGFSKWRQFVNINGESSSTDDVRAENRSMDICIDGTSLRISGADGQPLGIYGVDGRCEWQTTRYDGEAVELQPGIHVVRVGTAALKVSL